MPIEDLEKRAPFNALIERVEVFNYGPAAPQTNVLVGFSMSNGETYCLGGSRAADMVLIEFARSLRISNNYELPNAWLQFKSNWPQTNPSR